LRLADLADDATLEFVVPGAGLAARELGRLGEVHQLPYRALTFPDSHFGAPAHLARIAAQERTFGRHFDEHHPDLVLTSSMMVPMAVLAARRRRIPALVHSSVLLNAERLPSPLKRASGRILINRISSWATAVVACSESVADQFGNRHRVEVVYPPIAESIEPGDGRALRASRGIEPGQPCVTMVGNISRGRGQDVLVRAMAEIRGRLPEARCLIVGAAFDRPRDLAYNERLANLVRGLGLGGVVSFTGPISRVADVYAASDVVVNPARVPESFGRVACEALLAGTPVVSSRVGAVEEVLRDRGNALLVPPDDPSALADAVVESIADPAAARERTEAGRAEVLARFSPEPIAARFRQVVEGTLGGLPAPLPSEEPPAPSAPHPPAAEAPV
jgi:glycosyltransferase involved in cell wall biosynthesis